MKDFILAALPWVMMGLSLAVFFVSYSVNRKPGSKKDGDYGTTGMYVGMGIGMVVGSMTGNLALGMAPGLLFGMGIGMWFHKK